MVVEVGGKVSELLAALRTGEVTTAEVVSAHLAALRQLDRQTNAIAAFEDDRALAGAHKLDRAFAAGGVTGSLHGLPVTVKDWIDVAGFPCAGASAKHRGRRPQVDATVVARLRRAGAVVVAKTKAWGPTSGNGRVRHPVDPERSPGGSSTGEAVAVASGASPVGIGSDSGGSIRLPAAWCGAYGLKPTAGRVPATGHFPRIGALSDGRTQIGPLARAVEDLERVLAVIAGPDWRDAGVAPVPLQPAGRAGLLGARFAVIMGEAGWWPAANLAEAVERAAVILTTAGLTRTAWNGPWLAGAMDITRRYWARARLSGENAARQLWDWDRFRRHCLEAAENVDLLLTPATLEPAPPHREIIGDDFVFDLPASLTGSPAITVPMGHDPDGMPLAIQLVGRPWEDHRVLAAARLIP
ncbi:MAG: amidase [Micromonosporaceae bacterium]